MLNHNLINCYDNNNLGVKRINLNPFQIKPVFSNGFNSIQLQNSELYLTDSLFQKKNETIWDVKTTFLKGGMLKNPYINKRFYVFDKEADKLSENIDDIFLK